MTNSKLDNRTLKWLKDGRGAGNGPNYSPWLTVRDVSSKGRVHRVLGHLTQRTHHLLSDLELSTFLLLEWNPQVKDIREQYPLNVEETLEIAEELGIRHPGIAGQIHVMSSDFLVDLQQTAEGPIKRLAIQVKPLEALMDPRTLEKLQIEQCYWQRKDVDWKVVTERELPPVYVKNLAFLHSAARLTEPLDLLLSTTPILERYFSSYQTTRLPDVAMLIDQEYCLDAGISLSRIRALCALRIFQFDLNTSWESLRAADLVLSQMASVTEHLRYSNAES